MSAAPYYLQVGVDPLFQGRLGYDSCMFASMWNIEVHSCGHVSNIEGSFV